MTITEYEYAATTARVEQAIPWTEMNPLDRRS
jgi:hypothetical protein